MAHSIYRAICARRLPRWRSASVNLAVLEGRYWRYAAYRAYLNLLSDASRYHLGWLWWILEPLAMTGVFYVVFKFLRARDEEFIYFLIVGVTTWLWFSNSVSNAAPSLNAAKGLITQITVPKIMFPHHQCDRGDVQASVRLRDPARRHRHASGCQGRRGSTSRSSPSSNLLMIGVAATTAAFVCAWLPDARFVVMSGLQLLMFCSGIFFDIRDLSPEAQAWFWLNPIATMLDQYRSVLLYDTPPERRFGADTDRHALHRLAGHCGSHVLAV